MEKIMPIPNARKPAMLAARQLGPEMDFAQNPLSYEEEKDIGQATQAHVGYPVTQHFAQPNVRAESSAEELLDMPYLPGQATVQGSRLQMPGVADVDFGTNPQEAEDFMNMMREWNPANEENQRYNDVDYMMNALGPEEQAGLGGAIQEEYNTPGRTIEPSLKRQIGQLMDRGLGVRRRTRPTF